jgi:hypothetical protein
VSQTKVALSHHILPPASASHSIPSPPHANAVTAVRATATAAAPAAPTSTSGDYAKELEVAKDAVRMASTLCQEVQGQLMRQDEQAVTKDDKSLVTLADYAAQVGSRGVTTFATSLARDVTRPTPLFILLFFGGK